MFWCQIKALFYTRFVRHSAKGLELTKLQRIASIHWWKQTIWQSIIMGLEVLGREKNSWVLAQSPV